MNCTGRNCPIQADKVNPATCESHKDCPWVTKPITNADLIRAMSDEELANWIYNATTNALSILQIGSDAPTQNYFDWLNWLKRKVENK